MFMVFTQDSETAQSLSFVEEAALDGVIFPPSDLLSDEPPMESEFHLRQMMLLIQCLERWWHDRQDFYACGNMTIYYNYSPDQRKNELWSLKGSSLSAANTRSFNPTKTGGCGVSNWDCIWAFTSQNCASLCLMAISS
jgi:hypothetical protein